MLRFQLYRTTRRASKLSAIVATFCAALTADPAIAADAPKTIYVAIPPLKTDTAKAATEIQRVLKRQTKDVAVVDSPELAEFTVEVTAVGKRIAGEQRNAIIPGQTDTIDATVVAVKLCATAQNVCDTVDGDNAADVLKIKAVESAAGVVAGKIRKAIK